MTDQPIVRSIETKFHGRYLVQPPANPEPASMLVGFHGYAEDAETQLDRLVAIPQSREWLCVSIQALNRFYQSRTGKVVASWMTRQDRESAIADNLVYIEACLNEVATTWPVTGKVAFAGFSQGVAMAFRVAIHSTYKVTGVISVGGDVPPELDPLTLQTIPAALIVRGVNDHLYSPEQFTKDKERLTNSGLKLSPFESNSGHEWSIDVTEAANAFLRTI